MTSNSLLAAENAYFDALLSADAIRLAEVLADDFAIVDVLEGRVVPREGLLHLVGSGELQFLEIHRDPADLLVRERPAVGLVVGRTVMVMAFGTRRTNVESRYTHVFVDGGSSGWKLVAAQGTRLPSAQPERSE